VENGEKISIWRDNWIRRDGALKITGRNKTNRLNKVKSLFGSGNSGWNRQLVHSIFLPHDVENTLKMRATVQNWMIL
jgi:hypothetical protein